MTELIKKSDFIAEIINTMPQGDSRGVFLALIDDAPTTTESEIRASAIDEFLEKLRDAYSEHSTIIRLHGVDFDILTVDSVVEIMWDLFEQLKEE